MKYNILLTTVIIMLVMLIYIGSNKGLWIICCFLIVSLFPLCGSGFLKKLMTSKPLIFLGKISYSLYLAQFSVQVILNRSYSYLDITSRPGSILFFFFGITLLVFVSFILYKFIESPIRKKLNKRTHLNGLNVIPSS